MNSKTIKNDTIKNDDKAVKIISRIVILAFIIITIYPVIFVILTSFKETKEFYLNIWGLPEVFRIENYVNAWTVANMGSYFFNSIIVVALTLIATLITGSMAGYALSRFNIKFSWLIIMVILSCTMVPSEATIMPMYIITSRLGITGTHAALILPYIGWGLPMTIFIFTNFFNTLPNELIEAAQVDGYGEVRTFLKIASPLMVPAIATNAIFLFVSWWGELLWASVELASSPMKTIPIGVVSFSAQFGTDWGPLSAAVCIVLIPLVFFFLFTQKYFIGGLTGGAVKG